MNLITRSWNNTPISRRTTDGYVNATAMCKANGREWSKYRETDRCQDYIDALAQTTDFGGLDPIQSRAGNGGGTWIHPRLAVDLARWISAPFAVWMDGWFLEEVNGRVSQVRDTQPAPQPPVDVLSVVSRSIDLLERLGGVDERAEMLLRDVVLNANLLASGGSTPQLNPARDLTLSEYLIELGCPAHKATKLATSIGRQIKQIYRQNNGRDPKSQDQLVNGRRCSVALYERDWLIGIADNLKLAMEEAV